MKRPEPKLSRLQRKIVNEIKRLYRRGEPLNICAVKRRHPELLRGAYTVQPFWGWKRALKAAGLEYSDIKVELLDTVICEICHTELRAMGGHLALIHGIDKDDYHIDYPGADVLSETMRAAKMSQRRVYMKHWEAPWTPEYVLDRISELRAMGVEVNAVRLIPRESRLIYHARISFGTWNKALRAAGIDPRKEYLDLRRKQRRYPTPEAVVAGIKKRIEQKLPIYSCSISQGKHRNPALLDAAKKTFGTWNRALRAAKLDPWQEYLKLRRGRRRYPSPESVVTGIKKRIKQNFSINTNQLVKGEHRDETLWKMAGNYFGSWGKALRAAGIDPVKMWREFGRKRRRYPTPEAVVAGIKKRIKQNLPINSSGLMQGEYSDVALWNASCDYFGSWGKALRAAGIDPVKMWREFGRKRRRYPTPEAVVAEIKKRIEQNLPINSGGLTQGEHRDETLWKMAGDYFGSWGKALRAVGIDPVKEFRERMRKQRRYSTQEAVMAEIKRRIEQHIPTNCKSIMQGNFSDYALLVTANEYYGSWGKTLRAAGIDPRKEYRKLCRGKRRYPTPESVVAGIEKRIKQNLSINSGGLSKGEHRDYALLDSAKEYFGSWNEALNRSGLKLSKQDQ